MIKQKTSGTVIGLAQFSKTGAPVAVEVIYNSGSDDLKTVVEEYLGEYRWTCPWNSGEPNFRLQQQFSFTDPEKRSYVLRDTNLVKFLGQVKDIEKQEVDFKLDTMACPFDVVLTVQQPVLKNKVGEVGTANLNRAELLGWLETLSLDVSSAVFEQVLGQTVKIHVPCGTIKLGN